MKNQAYCLFLSALLLFSASARQPDKPARAPLPILPFLVEYEYAPLHLMQWINDHPQYAMIEAIIGDGEPPLIQLILTEKEPRRRVWYCNTDAKVKALTQTGKEAHLAAIDYKTAQNGGQPTYGLAFRDRHGQPLRWRFTPATAPSERGAGPTPQAAVPGLRLDYRDLGTTAGEGTAVQIGEKMIEADPWPEISSPPYFVAYRGSIALGRHIGALALGTESWRVTAAPQALREGAEWKLVNQFGRERSLRVTSQRGEELTISDSGGLKLIARATANGLTWRSLELTSHARTMRLTFSPELRFTDKTETAFQVDQAAHQKVAQGTVAVEQQGGIHTRWRLRWQPKSPDWARSRILETTVTIEANRYTVESTQLKN